VLIPAPPDRTLPLLGSPGSASLAGYRGGVVIVSFFASWCSPCVEQTPLLARFGRELRRDGAGDAVLVSVKDRPRDAHNYLAEHHLRMPALVDRDGQLADAYDIKGIPATFVLDRQGRVVAIHRGPVTERFLRAAIARAQRPR
jgi:cytochrome c biogenesis protein CcmG/thiol:disulfide interchange protein DsbE